MGVFETAYMFWWLRRADRSFAIHDAHKLEMQTDAKRFTRDEV
jgi:hypothetical protein